MKIILYIYYILNIHICTYPNTHMCVCVCVCVCVCDLVLTERYYQNLWLKTDINGTFSWDRVLFLHTPGNIQEDDALKLQLLDLGCEIRPVTLPIKKENNYREEHQVNNGKVSMSGQEQPEQTGPLKAHAFMGVSYSPPPWRAWTGPWSSAGGSQRKPPEGTKLWVTHTETHTHSVCQTDGNSAYPCIEHLVTEATVEFLGIGFCEGTQRQMIMTQTKRNNGYIKTFY